MINLNILNQLWSWTGISDIRLLSFLKIILLILFLLVNLGLWYSEYLDNKIKSEKLVFLKSGIGLDLKRVAKTFIGAAAAYSSYIAIINEHTSVVE